MVLLDTDHMSLLERGGEECRRIQARIRIAHRDTVATTVISYEEQMRGWLGRIAQARTPERQIPTYRELQRQLRNYCAVVTVDYDEDAVSLYQKLRQAGIRIGTMDLKIAAIALSRNAVLLSRNLADFGKIPNLRVEDWSIPLP
jgi:tRNA(fMet)-specific endonuclease VapC